VRIHVELETTSAVLPAVRRLLKALFRRYGIRCVRIREAEAVARPKEAA
jgi:hypothetical protein